MQSTASVTADGNEFLKKLFNIRNNVLIMMAERDYEPWIKKYYSDITFDKFEELYKRNQIDIYAYKTVKTINSDGESKDNLHQCIVYFVDPNSKMGKFKQQFEKEMQRVEQSYDPKADVVNVIMIADNKTDNVNMSSIEKYVTKYPLTYETKKSIKHEFSMELFYYKEMVINITQHYLVPHHVIIGNDEVQEILTKFKVTKDQLPRILKKDAIAKYYGAKVGDVFKIYRKNTTSGIAIHYRVVIEG